VNPETLLGDTVIDAVSAVFMVVGALMSLGAAIGLLRFPDLMSRMHAATKPQVLGLFLLLFALGLQLRTWWAWPVLVVAWLFQLLTVPVSAHMVGRAGYRTKHLHPELLSSDELEAVVQQAAGKRGFDDENPAGFNPDDAGSPDRRGRLDGGPGAGSA
jgi:multicomponent Na+:H+ antiporter subunit G